MIPTQPLSGTIRSSVAAWLKTVEASRSRNTYDTYRKVMDYFCDIVLPENGVDPRTAPVTSLTAEAMAWLITACHASHEKLDERGKTIEYRPLSPTSVKVYIAALSRYLKYLAAYDVPVNLSRVDSIVEMLSKRPGKRIPHFPRSSIEAVIAYAETLGDRAPQLGEKASPVEVERQWLIDLRDRAFILTLADTGLRVHEACGLLRSQIYFDEKQAVIIGKGDKQARVLFSTRSLAAIRAYLRKRQILDGSSGQPLDRMPVFARHDDGAMRRGRFKPKPISTVTGRDIVNRRVQEALGDTPHDPITPHTFRHYFVSAILSKTDNLVIAQDLARHSSVTTTALYSHMNEKAKIAAYQQTFEEGEPGEESPDE